MDYKFLNKVLDQIVRETRIDYVKEEIIFSLFSAPFFYFSRYSFFPSLFTKHFRSVYGLNEEEIDYVWEEYQKIILDKIESNG
jgi:hypothetical protein